MISPESFARGYKEIAPIARGYSAIAMETVNDEN